MENSATGQTKQLKSDAPAESYQRKFDFSKPCPRPFLANLPAQIDTYEEGVARFFQWRTGSNYYRTVDQIVDFVVDTQRAKVIDLLTDTATFPLRLAGRKAFLGRIYSFDTNITLLERAKLRAGHLNLQQTVEFRQFQEPHLPVSDEFGEIAVSIFDFHRHSAEQYLTEILRILSPGGIFVLAEMLEPEAVRNNWVRLWKKMYSKYVMKNASEAHAVYYNREEIIELLFNAGFRQVIVWGLEASAPPCLGIFSLIAATK